MKIVSVVGARPQFIKAAEVSRALSNSKTDEVLIHTGQHYDHDMSEIFFEELGIAPPAYHLGVGSGAHGQQTGKMLEGIEEVLTIERADGVLVYGDTNSTLAGSLAAAKLQIPIFHVEAGLRSFNRHMPEEINRVLTDHMSDILFCPTTTAVENLRREGVSERNIVQCGDVMFDSVLRHSNGVSDVLPHSDLERNGSILVTLHRAENTDSASRLGTIVDGLIGIARTRPVIFPVHPRTQAALVREGLYGKLSSAVTCIPPLSYFSMIAAQKRAELIITDSGGVQKEAFFLGKPSLVLRGETEWVELVQCGCTRLIEPKDIEDAVANAPTTLPDPKSLGIYGTGDTSLQITKAIEKFLA